MSIGSEKDFTGLWKAGRIVRRTLDEMRAAIQPGVKTKEIDSICAMTLSRYGARSAPMLAYGFPASVCISINDEVVHGIPGNRRIHAGDLVKLDLVVEKDGYMADAAITVAVPPVSEENRCLIACVEKAFDRAMEAAHAGSPVNEIGRIVESVVKCDGFHVVKELTGHGIGRQIHEAPMVPNYHNKFSTEMLTPGLVITVEPIISARQSKAVRANDGWTIKTDDGSLAAHYEHTIVITEDDPILLTAN